MAIGYLTPDSVPSGITCRSLFIPDDEQFIANVRGLLQEFTFPDSFVPYGMLTPQQTADAYVPMFDAFCFQKGPCKLIGEIVTWAGTANPKPGLWLDCDGASLLRTDYPDLFAIVGTTYGAVDGTHFSLPELRGRTVIDTGAGPGLTARALGDSLGEETHTLTVAETPSHSHTDTGHTHVEGIASPAVGAAIVGVPIPSAIPAVGATGSGFANLTSTGGDGSHDNIQPSLALNIYIVALDG